MSARTIQGLEGHPSMATGLYPRMHHASRRQFTILPGTFHVPITCNASFTSFRRSGSHSDVPNSSLSSLRRSQFVTAPCRAAMHHTTPHCPTSRGHAPHQAAACQAATRHRACCPMSRGCTSHHTTTHHTMSSRHMPRATPCHVKRSRTTHHATSRGRAPCTTPPHIKLPHATERAAPCREATHHTAPPHTVPHRAATRHVPRCTTSRGHVPCWAAARHALCHTTLSHRTPRSTTHHAPHQGAPCTTACRAAAQCATGARPGSTSSSTV